MKPIHPPRKRKAEKPGQPAAEKQPAPERERRDRSSEGAEDPDASKSTSPSREELNTAWSDPVTNQDEQDKITNAGGDDLPLADN